MEMKHKKIISMGVISLVVLTVFWYGIALAGSKASNRYLEEVRTFINNEDGTVDWVSVNEAIYNLGASTDENAEYALIQVLKREKIVRVTPGTPLPGVMPPLETLKASSIVSLEKMGSKKSIPDIERIYASTEYQVLRDVASEALKNLRNS